jgi:two-component system chemotaxis sensor kinase CheA
MDVVRTNVEKIGGKVEIDSRAGKGTTMRLRIPLTLAIIPALIVRSGGQSFALPQGALSEFVRVSRAGVSHRIEWIEDAPLLRLRSKLLPLVFLDRLLMPGGADETKADRDRFIAVLDVDGRRFGLVVDGLANPEEIVVKPLGAALEGIGLYTGATILGNGDLALILDPGAIASRARIAHGADEGSMNVVDSAPDECARGMEYLLVEAAGRNAAVSLGDVLRVERIPVSRIEYLGPGPVLHVGGRLLRVEDIGGVLVAAGNNPDASVIVIVCRRGEHHIGVIVSQVLDVAAGSELLEAGTGRTAAGVTLLKNRVTAVVDPGVPGAAAAEPESHRPDRLMDRLMEIER